MFDCIIIGAGPGGLVCTKELLEQGVSNILCLEQTNKIGGVFANSYDNLVLTSSCTFSMFSDFWMGDGKQYEFWTKQEFLDYLHRYAQHFGVFEKIRFNMKVMAVIPKAAKTWEIQLADGETLLTQRVALAIGSNSMPNYPHWKDSLTNINYSHSQEYRNAEQFVGKNVLVVGGGESASDIALEISQVANQSWVSLRNSTGWIVPRKREDYAADISTHRGIYGLPREYGTYISKLICQFELSMNDPVHNIAVKLNQKITSKNGIWGSYGTKNFSLPEAIAHYNCQVVREISQVENGGKTLITVDGEKLDNMDVVIFATGYQNYVSFLPENLKQTDPRSLFDNSSA